jgi:hypothetical protein
MFEEFASHNRYNKRQTEAAKHQFKAMTTFHKKCFREPQKTAYSRTSRVYHYTNQISSSLINFATNAAQLFFSITIEALQGAIKCLIMVTIIG